VCVCVTGRTNDLQLPALLPLLAT